MGRQIVHDEVHRKGIGGKYKVVRDGDVWKCSCPGWIYQRLPHAERKACKHIRSLIGGVSNERTSVHTGQVSR